MVIKSCIEKTHAARLHTSKPKHTIPLTVGPFSFSTLQQMENIVSEVSQPAVFACLPLHRSLDFGLRGVFGVDDMACVAKSHREYVRRMRDSGASHGTSGPADLISAPLQSFRFRMTTHAYV